MDGFLLVPFVNGLLVAGLIPAIGVWLRWRDEWLAALGLAHFAAAGGLLAQAWAWPVWLGALTGAWVGEGVKRLVASQGNSAYGLLILGGWAQTLLLAANTSLGEALAHATIEGQLYFTHSTQLVANLVLVLVAWPQLRGLGGQLVLARLFPEQESRETGAKARVQWAFAVLAASAVAASTATVGLMGTFALLFLPPWFAFRWGANWSQTHRLAVGLGLAAYGLSFWLAWQWDQPFAPLLVAVLLGLWALAQALGALTRLG